MIAPLAPHRRIFTLLFVASVAALAGALIAQHVFGLEPCILCLYQRIPFAIVAVLALMLALLPSSAALRTLGLALCALALLSGAWIAGYHVGVEQGWWASSVCQTAPGGIGQFSMEDLRGALSQPLGRPPCNEPAWSFYGITMAMLNLFYSLGLVALCALALRRGGKFPR